MFSYSLRELSATEVLDCIQKNIPFFHSLKKYLKKKQLCCQLCYFCTDIETGRCQINRGSLPLCLPDWAFRVE